MEIIEILKKINPAVILAREEGFQDSTSTEIADISERVIELLLIVDKGAYYMDAQKKEIYPRNIDSESESVIKNILKYYSTWKYIQNQ